MSVGFDAILGLNTMSMIRPWFGNLSMGAILDFNHHVNNTNSGSYLKYGR